MGPDQVKRPPPPPGFVPQSTTSRPEPPPGFVPAAQSRPAPPPGFVPVQQQKAPDNVLSPEAQQAALETYLAERFQNAPDNELFGYRTKAKAARLPIEFRPVNPNTLFGGQRDPLQSEPITLKQEEPNLYDNLTDPSVRPVSWGDIRKEEADRQYREKVEELRQKGISAYEQYPGQARVATTMLRMMGGAGGPDSARALEMMTKPSVKEVARAGAEAIPFVGMAVPEGEEPSTKAQEAAMALSLAEEEMAKRNLGDAVLQKVAGGVGFIARLASIKKAAVDPVAKAIGSAKGASSGTKLLMGTGGTPKTAYESVFSGVAPSSVAFGLTSAEPAIKQGDMKEATRQFLYGLAMDPAFRFAGMVGAKTADQWNAALGKYKLPESVVSKVRPGFAGAAQGVASVAPKVTDPDFASELASEMLAGAALSYTPVGKEMPGMRGILEQSKKKTANVEKATQELVERIKSETGKTSLPLTGDISFTELAKGKVDKAAWLLPKPQQEGGITLLTDSERAFRQNPAGPPLLDKLGLDVMETSAGKLYYSKQKLANHFVADKFANENLAVFKRGEDGFLTKEIDLEASVQRAIDTGSLGNLLKYGEGNESKEGATHVVTLYDRFNNEVTSIAAKNPDSAIKALKEYHGGDENKGAKIQVRTIDQLNEVLGPRQQKAAQDVPVDDPKVGDPITGKANHVYRAFDYLADEFSDAYKGSRHFIEGKIGGYGGAFTIEVPKGSNSFEVGTNSSLRQRYNPGDVKSVYVDVDYFEESAYTSDLFSQLREKFPNAKIRGMRLDDTGTDEVWRSAELPKGFAEAKKSTQSTTQPSPQEEGLSPTDTRSWIEKNILGLTPEQASRSMGERSYIRPGFSKLTNITEPGSKVTVDPKAEKIYLALHQWASVPRAAEIHAEVMDSKVRETARNNPYLMELAARVLVDARAESGAASGRAVSNNLFMNPETRAAYEANKGIVDEILKTFQEESAPLDQAWKEGGVKSKVDLREGVPFAHLTRVNLEGIEMPGSDKIEFSRQLQDLIDLAKREKRATMIGDPEIIKALMDSEGNVKVGSKEYQLLQSKGFIKTPEARRAGASKFATFESPVYSLDFKDITRASGYDAYGSSARNNVVIAMREAAAKDPNSRFSQVGDKWVTNESIDVGEIPQWLKDRLDPESEAELSKSELVRVPAPYARAYENLRTYNPDSSPGIARRLMQTAIGVDTTSTLNDSTSVSFQGFATLASMKGVAGTGKIGKIIESIGPARFLAAIKYAADTNDPQYMSDFYKLMRHGLIDVRSFGEMDAVKNGFVEKYSRIIPGTEGAGEFTYGVDGVISRAKIGLYRLMRQIGYSESKAFNEVIQLTGSVIEPLRPELVNRLANSGLVPYASKAFQSYSAGLRAFGVAPEGFRPRALAGTLSSMLMGTVLAAWLVQDEDELRGTTSPDRVLGMPKGARLGFVTVGDRQVPFLRNLEKPAERLTRTLGFDVLASHALAGQVDEETFNAMFKQIASTQWQQLGPGYRTVGNLLWSGSNLYGEDRKKPSVTDAITMSLPGISALDRGREMSDTLAFRGDPTMTQGNPSDRFARAFAVMLTGAGDTKARRDIEIDRGFAKQDLRSAEDKEWDLASKIKADVKDPARYYDAIVAQTKDMPDNDETAMFRKNVLDKARGSFKKDTKVDIRNILNLPQR